MKKTILSISYIILLVFFNSCAIGYSVEKNFTALTTTSCDTIPQNIELFFEGEKINFDYEKIGLIEIKGEYSSTNDELIEEVKKMAKNKCCDAVIHLKKNYADRDKVLLFTDVPNEKYTSIIYNGIAVRKKSTISNQ